jgi:hypothetical protein
VESSHRPPWSLIGLALLAAVLLACPGPDDDDISTDDDTSAADDDTGDDDSGDDDTSGDDDSGDDDTTADPYVQPETYVSPHDLEAGGTATVHYGGELADGESLSLRYGFNGWNLADGVTGYQLVTETGNTDFFIDAAMNPVQGGFELTVDLPTELRAFHYRFFRDDDGELTWDDNGGLDYHQSAVFPYIGPLLTWNGDTPPQSGVVVTFETSIPCLGTVEYGTSAALGESALGQELATVHHIPLVGLQPDTEVHYRVLDSGGHATAVHSFRTAPEDPALIRFAAMADMQDSGEGQSRWADVVESVSQDGGELDFLILPGDMPFDDYPGLWWLYFDRARDLLGDVVSMPAVGNHETPGIPHDPDTSSFQYYFDLPYAVPGGCHFRFDYGPVAFLALNSEVFDELAPAGLQYDWLAGELQSIHDAGDREWVFSFFHVPPYNAGGRLYEEQSDLRPLSSLFDGLVDWVFTGHEHLYQRMVPLRHEAAPAVSGEYGTAAGRGVGYMVLPPAGHKPSTSVVEPAGPSAYLRDLVAYPTIDEGQTEVDSEMGFVVVSLQANALTLDTWGMGSLETPIPARVIDVVSYLK